MVWSEEQVAFCVDLGKKQYTAGYIASAMSHKFHTLFSRSAVIGKMHRLGATFGTERDRYIAKEISKGRAKKQILIRSGYTNAHRIQRIERIKEESAAPVALPPEPETDGIFLGLAFDQLERHHCRFPRGDGPYFYCGQRKREGSSYCEDCHRIVWVKPPASKKPDPARPLRRNNHGVLDAEVL